MDNFNEASTMTFIDFVVKGKYVLLTEMKSEI